MSWKSYNIYWGQAGWRVRPLLFYILPLEYNKKHDIFRFQIVELGVEWRFVSMFEKYYIKSSGGRFLVSD